MSPSIINTDESTVIPIDENDGQIQDWIKQLEQAEQLMEQLEAKTEKLDARMDELLANLDKSNQPNGISTELDKDKETNADTQNINHLKDEN